LKIVLDQNVPAPLTRSLPGHNAIHTSTIGWEALSNGDRLGAAEADGFELLITADENIRYQQNLPVRKIVLSTNDWAAVRAQLGLVIQGVQGISPGNYIEVSLERPPLRRRPYSPGAE
jgi:hypothetical protein